MAEIYNFPPHTKGDTFKGKTFTIKINGDPIDSNDYNVRMQLKKGASSDIALEFSTTDGDIEKQPDGKFYIKPVIIDIPAGKYLYDMEFTKISGEVKTWVRGIWKINKEITFTNE